MTGVDMRDCSAETLQQYGEMAILVKTFLGEGFNSNLHEIVAMFCRVRGSILHNIDVCIVLMQ